MRYLMGKGKSGHKMNEAAKKNRARYVLLGTKEGNKARKARKQKKLNEKLLAEGKGPLFVVSPETEEIGT
jgi:hypothetical protein